MPTIILNTFIAATPEHCFDFNRSVDLHVHSAANTDERPVAGRTSGLLETGETVTWEARHLGIRQRLKVRITAMERPRFFVDEMEEGAFRRMRHEHYFAAEGEGTLMRDVFHFESPFGFLGQLFNKLYLTRYMRNFLLQRNQVIKEAAESGQYQHYLNNP